MNRRDIQKSAKRLKKRVDRKLDGDGAARGKVLAAAGIATAGLVGVGVARAVARRGANATTYHVVPDEDDWAVRRDGDTEPIGVFTRKRSAVSAARDAARDKEPSVLIIHGKDGEIQRSHAYGMEARHEEA